MRCFISKIPTQLHVSHEMIDCEGAKTCVRTFVCHAVVVYRSSILISCVIKTSGA